MYDITVFGVKAAIYAVAGILAIIFVFNGAEQAEKRDTFTRTLTAYEIHKDRKEFYYQMTVVVLLTAILISSLGIPGQETVSQLLNNVGNRLFGSGKVSQDNNMKGDFDLDF